MARKQLFGSLEGFGLISSEDRCHRDALGQVSAHVEQQVQAVRAVLELPCCPIKVEY
jgi:hypothetical protein